MYGSSSGKDAKERYVQDVRSAFLFPTKAKYLHPCKQLSGGIAEICSRRFLSTYFLVSNAKELLWFGFFFAYMDVGKGREQDAEAFRKKK